MKKSVWSGGHTQSVLSLDHSEDEILASGAEDGFVSLWSNDGVPRFKFSVAFGDSQDVTSVCFCSKESKHLYVSCGKKICFFDTRNVSSPVWQIEHSKDEINQIALNHKNSFLAAADDSGEIQIFELPSAKPFKTLSRRHTDICSCVQFRPQRPWEVISGGMDYNIFNWDFSSGRPVCLVNIQEIISADDGDEMENNYVVNPPYINSIHMSIESRRFACGLGEKNFIPKKMIPRCMVFSAGVGWGIYEQYKLIYRSLFTVFPCTKLGFCLLHLYLHRSTFT